MLIAGNWQLTSKKHIHRAFADLREYASLDRFVHFIQWNPCVPAVAYKIAILYFGCFIAVLVIYVISFKVAYAVPVVRANVISVNETDLFAAPSNVIANDFNHKDKIKILNDLFYYYSISSCHSEAKLKNPFLPTKDKILRSCSE